MSTSMLINTSINALTIGVLFLIVVYVVKTQKVRSFRLIYFLVCILMFTSIFLTETFRISLLDSFPSLSGTASIFVLTLMGTGLGQLTKFPISILSSKYQIRKQIISISYLLFSFVSVLLFLSVYFNNEILVTIFIILSSITTGMGIGLSSQNLSTIENMNNTETYFKSTLLIALSIFIGQAISTIPQSTIIIGNHSLSDSQEIGINLSYLWLISAITSFIAFLLNVFLVKDIYQIGSTNFVATNETRKKSVEEWKNSDWFPNKNEINEIYSNIFKTSLIGIIVLFVYSMQSDALGVVIFDTLDSIKYGVDESGKIVHTDTSIIFKGNLSLILAMGAILGSYFGIKHIVLNIDRDKIILNFSLFVLFLYFLLNIFNSAFINSSILFSVGYFFLGFGYGLVFYYFFIYAILITNIKKKKIPIGSYYLTSYVVGTVLAELITSLLIISNTSGANYLIIINSVSLGLIVIGFIILSKVNHLINNLKINRNNWGKENLPIFIT